MLFIPVAIESLIYLTPSQTKGKFMYPLKHKLDQKVHAQLYSTFLVSSKIITQFLSACWKCKLHLLLDSTTNHSWVMEGFLEPALLFFGQKENINIRFWKLFLWKNKFPQSLKSTKKYNSKYNGYRSVIDIAQNFGNVQNKNFNLCTRQI